jgi:predicted amidohydrolase
MAEYVNVAAIHFEINSERAAADAQEKVLEQFHVATSRLAGTGVDLLVTCEGMESIGQTMAEAESSTHPGPLYKAYRDFAVQNKCTVGGSIKLEDAGKVFNAIIFIGPAGEYLGDYRKTYLTDGEKELGLSQGSGACIVETPSGRVGGVICFDLNFDALRDSYRALKPDILAFSSMFHGDHLQQNWAYQCRSYMISACKDNSSDIVDPLGRVIASVNYHGRIVRSRINLDRFVMHQDKNVELFPEIYRKYTNKVCIDYNPKLGVAALYSTGEDKSAAEIAEEFNLIELDEYLKN